MTFTDILNIISALTGLLALIVALMAYLIDPQKTRALFKEYWKRGAAALLVLLLLIFPGRWLIGQFPGRPLTIRISGSTTVGEILTPELVEAFLKNNHASAIMISTKSKES